MHLTPLQAASHELEWGAGNAGRYALALCKGDKR
jgi:hypothetical protein